MTRAEAIKKLLILHSCTAINPKTTINQSDRNAIDMAITALLEQEQREQGCERCDDFQKDPHFYVSEGNGQYTDVVFKFCPMCGRRLED